MPSCCARTSTSGWPPRTNSRCRCRSPRPPPNWWQAAVGSRTRDEDFARPARQQAAASGLELKPENVDGRRRAAADGRGHRRVTTRLPLPAPGHTGVDYEKRVDFDRLRDYRLGAREGGAGGSDVRRVPALRLLQHPLHDPDLDRRRARRQDDPVRVADPRRRARCCGTSARRRGTTSCTRRGWSRRTAGPACSACAARSRPTRRADGVGGPRDQGRCWPTPASPTRRSASTSSSRRSCSRCSARG